jgi:hypothetical protein
MARRAARARLLALIVGLQLGALAEAGRAEDEYEEAPNLEPLERLTDRAHRGIPVSIRVRSDTRFVFGSDFGSADANLYWPSGSLQVGVPLSKRAAIRFRLSGGDALYDFDGSTDLFGSGASSDDPFDDLCSGSFAIEGAYRLSETWALVSQGLVAARWEDGARFGSGISGGGGLAIGYRNGDRLDVVLGAGLKSRLDRSSPGVYPLVDLEWMIDEHWKLRVHGAGIALEYRFSDSFKLFLRGAIESRSYRLDDRLGPASRGTVRDRQSPVGVGFRWVINRHFRIGAAAGVMVEHKLKVRDQSRSTIASISADPAPYLEVRIDLRP